MSKTWLIIKREFTTRVRKRSFIIMTILGPILSSALFILPAYLATLPDDHRTITVLDQPGLMDFARGNDNITFRYLPPHKFNLESAKHFFHNSGDYAFLFIPSSANNDPDIISNGMVLYSNGDVSLGVQSYIEINWKSMYNAKSLKPRGWTRKYWPEPKPMCTCAPLILKPVMKPRALPGKNGDRLYSWLSSSTSSCLYMEHR